MDWKPPKCPLSIFWAKLSSRHHWHCMCQFSPLLREKVSKLKNRGPVTDPCKNYFYKFQQAMTEWARYMQNFKLSRAKNGVNDQYCLMAKCPPLPTHKNFYKRYISWPSWMHTKTVTILLTKLMGAIVLRLYLLSLFSRTLLETLPGMDSICVWTQIEIAFLTAWPHVISGFHHSAS